MSPSALEPVLLSAFVAVAERRSFTGAALALHRTQSAVSLQVKRLETRLGVELFRRTTTSVTITPAGESLLGYARRLLTLGEEAVGQVLQSEIEGRVRLGVMEDYGATIVPPLLASFARSFPRVQVEMETGLTSAMPERLGSDFDLVVAMHGRNARADGPDPGTLLRVEEPVWVTSPNWTVAEDGAVTLAVARPGCLFRAWATEALETSGRKWRIAFVSQSQAAVLSVVAEGLAVSVVKAGICPPGLRRLTARDGWPELPMAEIRLHRAPRLDRAARHLGDHLVAGLGDPPPAG